MVLERYPWFYFFNFAYFSADMEIRIYRNDSLRNWIVRYLFFFIGLVCFSLGSALTIKVQHLGIHPWDVLNVAFFQHFGISIGFWSVIVGLILIMISLFINQKYINIGTFLNALLIDPILDFFLWLDVLPEPSYTWTDYLWLLLGILIVGTGGGLYVSGGIGAVPRDGFMLSMACLENRFQFRLKFRKGKDSD